MLMFCLKPVVLEVWFYCRTGLISSLIGEKSVTQRWEVSEFLVETVYMRRLWRKKLAMVQTRMIAFYLC